MSSGNSELVSAAKNVGMQKKSVGCSVVTMSATSCGVGGRVGSKMVVAPAANGNVSELPRPYAWNTGPTEKHRSSAVIPSTCVA